MVSLSVSVMAHPKRADLIPDLVKRLDIADDQVVWDKINSRWDTGRRAWEVYDRNADYHMVIQDDAMVVQDLIPGLEKALEYVPEKANVCPFVGTRRPMKGRVDALVALAEQTHKSWIEFPSLFWGVAIIVPTHVIPDMLAFGDRITAYPNYDKRVGQYFVQRLHWPTWCTWPTLVDHRDVESLVGHGEGRVSHRFAGEDVSALDLDFSRGCLPKTSVPGMVKTRQTAFRRPGASGVVETPPPIDQTSPLNSSRFRRQLRRRRGTEVE